jgi:hypothetical protein
MGLARKLYEQIEQTPDERARFRLIIDALGKLEEGWPRPGESLAAPMSARLR